MEAAYLVHQSSGRLRLRLPGRRRDARWLEAAALALRQAPGIVAVRSCAATACLTLHLATRAGHATAVVQPALNAAGIRLVGLAPSPRSAPHHPQCTPPPAPPQPTAAAGLRADRRTLALALFLLLLARHLVRSGWLVPGLALAWYLWESLPMLRRAMRGSSERTRS
jgi:hypothetical protein